jgi:hypothetical protein
MDKHYQRRVPERLEMTQIGRSLSVMAGTYGCGRQSGSFLESAPQPIPAETQSAPPQMSSPAAILEVDAAATDKAAGSDEAPPQARQSPAKLATNRHFPESLFLHNVK